MIEKMNRRIILGKMDPMHQLVRDDSVRVNIRRDHLNYVLEYYDYHGSATPQEISLQLLKTSKFCKTIWP